MVESSKSSTLTINPYPPKGDFNKYPNIIHGLRVKLVMVQTTILEDP